MGANSKISWTDHTFNPWIGCTKVHEGCTNCYAEAFSKRTGKAQWGPSGTRVKTSEANWKLPVKWNREAEESGERRRVFCASLADVFEDWTGEVLHHSGERLPRKLLIEESGVEWATMADLRAWLFALIDSTPMLDWLLLTKRPENVRRMWCSHINTDGSPPSELYRQNVWLLTSVSNQVTADKMIPELLACKGLSPVLGISAEPLLGPVNLAANPQWLWAGSGLKWAIVGGESGPSRRMSEVSDIVSLVRQCQTAGVPCFVKQDVAAKPGRQGRIPDDVWAVQEFPNNHPLT